MYYEHFGLKQAPFKITPNTDFFFGGGNRGPILEALIYAITHGEGIVKVTGEVGSGKTMLCNMLQNRLPENVESVYLANPSVAPDEVLHAIAFELQLGLDRKADRLEVTHALQDYLVKRHGEGKRVVVFIEESQSMPLATLEEIRLLSNLETGNDKLLQIVLFGQPELDENLRRPNIRQLRDRIAHSFRLEPFTDGEAREYLMFRMRAAGYRGPEIFTPAIVKQITKASSGLTRRINLIADKALLAAFSENTHTVDPKHVQAALRDSEFSPPQAQRQLTFSPAVAWAALALVIGAGLGSALYALFEKRSDGATSTPPVAAATPAAPASPAATPIPTGATATKSSGAAPPTVGAVALRRPASPQPATSPAMPPDQPKRTEGRMDGASAGVAGTVAPVVASQSSERQAAKTAPQSAAQQAAMSGDVVADRMEATRRWLDSDISTAFSIQLLNASNEEQLRNNLKALPKFVEIKDIYMYRSEANGRPIVNVLWGSYPSRQEAQEELAELPEPWRVNRPYVRTINGIRAEIDRQTVARRR